MTGKYSKLTLALKSAKTSSAYVANVFFDFQIVHNSIFAYVLTDSKVQFTSDLFATLFTMLGVKHQQQLRITIKLVEKFNGTIIRKQLDCGIMLPKTKKTRTNKCKPLHARTTRKCTSPRM